MVEIKAYICTRSGTNTESKNNLQRYLWDIGGDVALLEDKTSMFSAFSEQFEKDKGLLADTDIIIMCHDDIQILSDPKLFKAHLTDSLSDPKVAFVGPAGTTLLDRDAVWWDHGRWAKGFHKGFIFHGHDQYDMQATYYGPCGNVVVLDGVFLAATVRTLKQISLEKPKNFVGEWDFYDLTYTLTAYEKGFFNKTIPILILHSSKGELAGRDSWHKNRSAFIKNHLLPVKCS